LGESDLHRRMKERVSRDLIQEGYSVFVEPSCAPSRFLSWAAYRPDLFGIRASAGRQEYAFVEARRGLRKGGWPLRTTGASTSRRG
jgi:hypothetical protein